MHPFDELSAARYARLRSYRRDGTPVDTPIWFGLDGTTVVFRTKVGPKTKRLATRPDVELTACDYRGRVRTAATKRCFGCRLSLEIARRVVIARKSRPWMQFR